MSKNKFVPYPHKLGASACEVCNDANEIDHHVHNTYVKAAIEYHRQEESFGKGEEFGVMPHMPVENSQFESGWLCADCFESLKIDKRVHKSAEDGTDSQAMLTRMRHSAFWLFLWNTVYDQDNTAPPFDDTQDPDHCPTRGKGTMQSRDNTVPNPETQVAMEMIENFSTIRIGLISKDDCLSKGTRHCQRNLMFSNGLPCQWTVDRCKIFQDILTRDCVVKERVSRPLVVPVQHLILKLPANFVAGFYSIAVTWCCNRLSESRGMYLTARDVDAENVFESDVLDHKGNGWVWEDMDDVKSEDRTKADVHSFSNLYKGKFLCENEPGKEMDVGDIEPDEFGRRTIWIGIPPTKEDVDSATPQTLTGEFGQNVPPGIASQWYKKDRIPQGHIAAIGMEIRTHDNQDVQIFCDKEDFA